MVGILGDLKNKKVIIQGKYEPIIEYICKYYPYYNTCNSLYKFYTSDNNRPKPTIKQTQFKEWYKKASIVYLERQNILNKISDEQTIAEKIEAKKQTFKALEKMDAILIDKFDYVSKIKKGIFYVKDINGNIVSKYNITINDELKAIDTLCKLHERLNKKHGTDAANKVAQTDTEGKDILNQKNATIVFNIS